jgi:hypothetical protein
MKWSRADGCGQTGEEFLFFSCEIKIRLVIVVEKKLKGRHDKQTLFEGERNRSSGCEESFQLTPAISCLDYPAFQLHTYVHYATSIPTDVLPRQ